ncbi:hypothetical protein CBR_g20120 [Chara braunii]|uniref:UmuC domain-containing protein n=1 Tax=Chara braunii TaxID=69332 RepID=A0A388KZK8_CHABU|nr:hypothetical protein CBR_g20120 [Chara braunii]|eukprot:GBG75489.1 hypothetical protein CBR_g20120 [Chara braunii]
MTLSSLGTQWSNRVDLGPPCMDKTLDPSGSKTMSSSSENRWRVVLHLDADCFYAQVEELNRPELRERPLGITQKQLVVTCNYVARRLGVPKMALVDEAKRRCPDLVLINGEDLSPYRRASKRILAVLQRFGVVERLGLDEAYIDVSDEAYKRYVEEMPRYLADPTIRESSRFVGHVHGYGENPRLVAVSQQWYGDSDCVDMPASCSGRDALSCAQRPVAKEENFLSVSANSTTRDNGDLQRRGEDEARYEHEGGVAMESYARQDPAGGIRLSNNSRNVCAMMHPVDCRLPDEELKSLFLLMLGSHLAAETRSAVETETGFKLSGGIAHNKMLAKIACNLHKPNAQTTMPESAVAEFIASLPVRKLFGVGSRLEMTLKELGLYTASDVRLWSLGDLQRKFGERVGDQLFNSCRGIDRSEVKDKGPLKSLSVEDSCRSCTTMQQAESMVRLMAPGLLARIEEDREDTGRVPRTFVVKWRQKGQRWGKAASLSCTLPCELAGSMVSSAGKRDAIVQAAMALLSRGLKNTEFCLLTINIGVTCFIPRPSVGSCGGVQAGSPKRFRCLPPFSFQRTHHSAEPQSEGIDDFTERKEQPNGAAVPEGFKPNCPQGVSGKYDNIIDRAVNARRSQWRSMPSTVKGTTPALRDLEGGQQDYLMKIGGDPEEQSPEPVEEDCDDGNDDTWQDLASTWAKESSVPVGQRKQQRQQWPLSNQPHTLEVYAPVQDKSKRLRGDEQPQWRQQQQRRARAVQTPISSWVVRGGGSIPATVSPIAQEHAVSQVSCCAAIVDAGGCESRLPLQKQASPKGWVVKNPGGAVLPSSPGKANMKPVESSKKGDIRCLFSRQSGSGDASGLTESCHETSISSLEGYDFPDSSHLPLEGSADHFAPALKKAQEEAENAMERKDKVSTAANCLPPVECERTRKSNPFEEIDYIDLKSHFLPAFSDATNDHDANEPNQASAHHEDNNEQRKEPFSPAVDGEVRSIRDTQEEAQAFEHRQPFGELHECYGGEGCANLFDPISEEGSQEGLHSASVHLPRVHPQEVGKSKAPGLGKTKPMHHDSIPATYEAALCNGRAYCSPSPCFHDEEGDSRMNASVGSESRTISGLDKSVQGVDPEEGDGHKRTVFCRVSRDHRGPGPHVGEEREETETRPLDEHWIERDDTVDGKEFGVHKESELHESSGSLRLIQCEQCGAKISDDPAAVLEHSDFHFALRLQNGDERGVALPGDAQQKSGQSRSSTSILPKQGTSCKGGGIQHSRSSRRRQEGKPKVTGALDRFVVRSTRKHIG